MRTTKRYLNLSGLLFILSLAACGSWQPPAAARVGEVDFIRLKPPGKTRCIATSNADNAAAAEITNIMRSKIGFAPVEASPVLARAAARHACDMAKHGQLAQHALTPSRLASRLKQHGYLPLVAAGNTEASHHDDDGVLHQWNKSSDHLANILIPQIREFGIGQAIAADGKTRYWIAIYSVSQ